MTVAHTVLTWGPAYGIAFAGPAQRAAMSPAALTKHIGDTVARLHAALVDDAEATLVSARECMAEGQVELVDTFTEHASTLLGVAATLAAFAR